MGEEQRIVVHVQRKRVFDCSSFHQLEVSEEEERLPPGYSMESEESRGWEKRERITARSVRERRA